jgi:small-conductance mechanosensitive channel
MILIDRWIKGNQNFIVGKNLYDTYGTDKNLKALFARGETPFAKQKLHEALKLLVKAEKKPVAKPAVIAATEMPKATDEVLIAIEQQWQPLYQEMNLLRHKLDEFGDDNTVLVRAKRNEYAQKILDLEQQCMALWNKRDYYEQHGQLPEVKEKEEKFIIPEDPVELATLISTLKRYVRRYKKSTKDKPDNPLYPALQKKYQIQLDQILSKKK